MRRLHAARRDRHSRPVALLVAAALALGGASADTLGPSAAALGRHGVASGALSPAPTGVLDVRIDGTERRVLLRDDTGTVLRDLSATPLGLSLGQEAPRGPGGVRHIRIVGGGAAGHPAPASAEASADDYGQLPRAYDPTQDPYVQYPELLDPSYYQSSPE